MQDGIESLVRQFCDERGIDGFDDLEPWGYSPTPKQKAHITKQVTRAKKPIPFRDAFARKFVSDKFGEATTHWDKLDLRIRRGVGNPCPLVFIGMPVTMVTMDEGKAALREIEAGESDLDL